jgi:CheY-like chemotaxis protein
MFNSLGHKATIAATGAEALALFSEAQKEHRPFDMVFVDLTMPGDLSGEEVIQRLRSFDPWASIVIMTGYSTSEIVGNHRKLGLVGALAKPFDTEAVREMLARI